MTETVINIRAVDAASGAIQKVGSALGSLKNAVGGLALGAARVGLENLGAAARATWDALNEGAALEETQRRFENLAGSIGTTAAALDSQMAAASQGMMSHAEQMALAGDVIELGLADSGQEVAHLSVLIDELGWNTSALARTMATDSKAGVTALGLSLDDVRAKTEAYTAAGVAASEAFDLAVIDAGEEKMAAYGSAVDSTADKIQQLTVMWQDAVDAFKVEFASGVGDQLDEIIDLVNQGGPDLVEGMGYWGKEAGDWLGNMMAGAASEGMQRMTDDLKDQLVELGVTRQELAALEREATDRPLPFIYDAKEGIKYYNDLNTALETTYGVMLQLNDPNAWATWATGEKAAIAARDAVQGAGDAMDATTVITDGLSQATEEYTQRVLDAVDAGEALIVTQKGLILETGQVGDKINIMAELADVAAKAMGRGADKASALKAAMLDLEDTTTEGLEEHAAAAEALAEAYQEAAGRMADAFNAALEPGGGMNFDNANAMAEAAWSMTQAFGLTVPQLGEIGVAMGEITPEMAEAAAKAAIFQEAFGNLLGQFQAGNLDTGGFIEAYNGLIDEMRSNSLVEIQVELAHKENPARDLWAWLPKEERQTVEIPIEFTPEQSALSQALSVIDGIPGEQEKIINFGAEYTDVTDAVTTIEADIAAIDATVLMAPETAELDAKIALVDESRLTMYVDFVVGETPAIPGKASGGPVAGGSPYIVGENGPEFFVPWTNGTIVPNSDIGGAAGGVSMVLNFYGPTSAAAATRAVDTAGQRLIQKMRQAGLPR